MSALSGQVELGPPRKVSAGRLLTAQSSSLLPDAEHCKPRRLSPSPFLYLPPYHAITAPKQGLSGLSCIPDFKST